MRTTNNVAEQPTTISQEHPVEYFPLVSAAKAHGISRTVAFELANSGLLTTFLIGRRRYVYTQSLRELPQRIAERDAKEAA